MTTWRTTKVMLAVGEERQRQDAKWGEQNHDLTVWMTVLGEEFGEACHAALHYRGASGLAENVEGDTDPAEWLARVRYEAIQTAAVAVAIVEYIDRGCPPAIASRPVARDTAPRPLLRVEQVAERLRISRSAAWRLVHDGRLPSLRIGRSVRIRPDDLDRYINVNEP